MKKIKGFILMAILAVCVALTGVFGSLRVSRAISTDVINSDDRMIVPELWNDVTNRFYEDNLKSLLGLIAGQSGTEEKSVDELYALVEEMAKTSKTSTEINNVNGKDLEVTIGGLTWQIVYLSTDDSDGDEQNVILTLWLSSYKQDSWQLVDDSDFALGDYYGYAIAGGYTGLYADWSADWSGTKENPSNIYLTSYIRSVVLNNGGEYLTNGSSVFYDKSSDSIFSLFTYKDGRDGLIDHIVQPSNVSWQKNEQSRDDIINDNSTESWGNDYLWLPSFAETGDVWNSGIWQTTANQRINHVDSDKDSEILADFKGIGTTNNSDNWGTANFSMWLRTANSTGSNATGLYFNDAYGVGDRATSHSLAVRPAFHLNLTTAKNATIDPVPINDQDGNLAENFNLNIENFKYDDGKEIDIKTSNELLSKIKFTHNINGDDESGVVVKSLSYGRDYIFEIYADKNYEKVVLPKDAGIYYIEITGIGDYTGTIRTTFEVSKKQLDHSVIKIFGEEYLGTETPDTISVPFNRENHKFQIYVIDEEGSVVPEGVFKIEYRRSGNVITTADFTKAGIITYRITVNTGYSLSANYDENSIISGTIEIKRHELINAEQNIRVEILADKIIYNGNAQTPDYNVYYKWNDTEVLLHNSVDYTGEFSENKDVGFGKITITFIGDYLYTNGDESNLKIVKEFEISSASIGKLTLVCGETRVDADGTDSIDLRLQFSNSEYLITLVVVDTSGEIISSENLVFEWSGAIISSSESITLKNVCVEFLKVKISAGNPNYTEGELEASIEIYSKNLTNVDITYLDDEDYIYSGSEINPNFEIYDIQTRTKLIYDVDYVYVIENNKNAGTATIKITLKGNYSCDDTINKEFTIHKKVIDVSEVQWDYDNEKLLTYDGSEKQVTLKTETIPEFVRAIYNGNTGIHASTYFATVEFEVTDDNYEISGEIAGLNWRIRPKSVVLSGVIDFVSQTFTFDREGHWIYVENLPEGVRVVYEIDKMLDNRNIRINYNSGCVDVGNYNFTAKFEAINGDYTISEEADYQKTAILTISPLDFSLNSNRFNCSLIRILAYTGKALTPTVTVTVSGTTTALRDGEDYYVEYQNNIEIGTATVIIHGKGNYTGELTDHFEIRVTAPNSGSENGGSTATGQGPSEELNLGLIIGVFAGLIVVFTIIIVVVVVVLKKKKNRNHDDF